MFQTLPFN